MNNTNPNQYLKEYRSGKIKLEQVMSDHSIESKITFATKLSKKLKGSNNWLFSRIGKSLSRDKDYPLGYLIKKGISFFFRILLSRLYLRKTTRFGKHPRVEKKPYLVNLGEMYIGDNVNVCSRSVPCDLVSYPGGTLDIGDDVFVNFGTTICAQNKIRIGNNVKIGPYCMIHDTDFHVPGIDFAAAEGVPIIIEDDVWLSSRVLVMKGSVIGKGSVIAAGSVVTGIIPPNVTAGGVPAKILKYNTKTEERTHTQSDKRINIELKSEIDFLIGKILGIDLKDLNINTVVTEIPNWTAENHVLIVKELEQHFSVTANDSILIKLNTLKKIYDWVQNSVSKCNQFKVRP